MVLDRSSTYTIVKESISIFYHEYLFVLRFVPKCCVPCFSMQIGLWKTISRVKNVNPETSRICLHKELGGCGMSCYWAEVKVQLKCRYPKVYPRILSAILCKHWIFNKETCFRIARQRPWSRCLLSAGRGVNKSSSHTCWVVFLIC